VTGPADILHHVEAAYRQHFEVAPARASVSFLGVDAIEILRYPEGRLDHYLTLGMSRHPMSDPGEAMIATEGAPRAELLLAAAGRPEPLWRNLAVLAAAPAVEGVVYQVGNTVDLGEPLCSGSRCSGGVLATAALRPITLPDLAAVHVLQVLPATHTELAWARVHGSEQLQQRWLTAGTDLADLMRDPVDLG